MKIREAKDSDAKALSGLIAQLGYPDMGEPDVLKKIQLHRQPDYKFLIAEEGNQVVGFLTLHDTEMPHRNGKIGRITAMCTDESVRSKGIGSKLVKEAEDIMRMEGCVIVEVTSNNRRTRAHAFYLKGGYEHTSKRFVKSLK